MSQPLVIAAIPARVDPRDALCARDGLTLGELGEGAVVGTGSPRRRAQLAALGLGAGDAAVAAGVVACVVGAKRFAA